ncbi:MAG: helix-turn-helix domain-containing protein [Lachnospiraceae bacterium]|nr:helix-turn-helix domain-containing protein [Lachnospiraceae bacterium]
MILADKIINERKKLGWSQEDLAEKLDCSRQSVSKWESAQSTPDLNRILMMAELFGVSTDYLLKDEIEDVTANGIMEEKDSSSGKLRNVSMEEATEFLKTTKEVTPKVALGVSLCIMSPVIMMALLGMAAAGKIAENAAVALGVPAILVFVAIAVFIFIMCGRKTDRFDYLEKEMIETAYGVDGMVKERKKREDKKNTMLVAIGVILCILSAVPLLLASIFENCIPGESDEVVLYMVAVLLCTIAIGVNLIINGGSMVGAYNKLLQEGDYTESGKRCNKVISLVAGIYWPVIVLVYFILSFTVMGFGTSWFIWPISGILFGAICGIIKACMQR